MSIFKPNLEKLEQEGDMGGLCKALRHRNEDVRTRATWALRDSGAAEAVEPLIEALGDQSPAVRDGAATALGRLGDPRSVKPLIARLNDPEDAVGNASAEALAEIGDNRAVQPLAFLLGSEPERRTVIEALTAFLERGEEAAVEPLIGARHRSSHGWPSDLSYRLDSALSACSVDVRINALGAADPATRRWAAARLGAGPASATVEPLIAALGDESADVRAAAAVSLGGLGDRRAVDPLIALLVDADGELAGKAAEALGTLGDERAVRPLVQAFGSRREGFDARTSYAALQELGSPEAEAAVKHDAPRVGDRVEVYRRDYKEAGMPGDRVDMEIRVKVLEGTIAEITAGHVVRVDPGGHEVDLGDADVSELPDAEGRWRYTLVR